MSIFKAEKVIVMIQVANGLYVSFNLDDISYTYKGTIQLSDGRSFSLSEKAFDILELLYDNYLFNQRSEKGKGA